MPPQRTLKQLYTPFAMAALVLLGLLALAGGILAIVAPGHGETLPQRVASLLPASIVLCLFGGAAWTMARRKSRTGRFRLSEEERRALLAKAAAQRASHRWRRRYTIYWCVLAAIWLFLPFAIKLRHPDRPLSHWIFYFVLSALGLYTAARELRRLHRRPKQA